MRYLCIAAVLAVVQPVIGAEWIADRERSRLGFTAIQQGAEFQGEFSRYTARLRLDETDLSTAWLDAYIQLDSVNTLNDERDEYLRQQDWFYVAMFPEARFVSRNISRNEDGSYLARGTLTLRGVTGDVMLRFTFDEDTQKAVGRLVGTAPLNRLDYGVGQGEWTDTKWVGDRVNVEVDLYMLPGPK